MLVEFIIPTYNRVNPLFTMLYSLINQTDQDWKAHVIIDDSNNNYNQAQEVVESFYDKRIRFSYLDKRYNDWGHTPREFGKNVSDADYVIMTGDDNYYVPLCVSEIRKVAETSPGLIYWDMVHSHYQYTYFKCEPFIGRIDMGSFATRTDLAKQIKLGTVYAADGLYIEEFKKIFPDEKIIKINNILFVHN